MTNSEIRQLSNEEIMKKIAPENGSLDWVDSTGEIIIVEKSLPSIWAGKSLNNLLKTCARWQVL